MRTLHYILDLKGISNRIVSTVPVIALLLITLTGCAGYKPFVAPDPLPDDRYNIRKPEFKGQYNDFADAIDKQFVLQVEQFMDLSRHVRNLSGNPKEAYNVNAFDEVHNSSWFTNRHAHKRMSIDEIARGPNRGDGPDTSSTWTIIRAKAEGVTPGFTIVDNHGDRYVVKFDPPGYAGLNSGSEVIGAKLFYAAGFNTPENYVTFFDPRILKLADKVKFTDEKGRKRLMNKDDLQDILGKIEYLENGLIRATASKYVPGEVLGPFRYESIRKDDPNDFIPHQHRRELRGLRVMSAWLNNIDAKGANSMDTYISENGRSFVRHYLIDFGTILGSGGRGPQPIYRGHENEMDPHALILRTLTLGLYSPGWERVPEKVEYPCIGRYHSQFYHPQKFKIIFPNPAFDNLTAMDGYWGAKLVMSFTDGELRAVIDEAKYPDPEAADQLLKTMIERRDITGKYWFNRVTPLDRFELITNESDEQELKFVDLAVETGLEPPGKTIYRYSLSRNGVEITHLAYLGAKTSIKLPNLENSIYKYMKPAFPQDQWEVTLQLRRGDSGKWSKWVKVYIAEEGNPERYSLIGLRREG